jgi:hypothetical protein
MKNIHTLAAQDDVGCAYCVFVVLLVTIALGVWIAANVVGFIQPI